MSRLVQIGWSEMLDLGIPTASVRFYAVYCDQASVDKRRVRRHIRRARREPCCETLKDWRRRRLNTMERRL